ncbi:MAG: phytanoyl-CoA dioxygenase family protein [Planctomycetes bacterium]|nr:phytanoyl-CoA dioxygenase family protein [Planctomycetota bacterium]
MKVTLCKREVELGGKYLDADLRESNDILGKPAALHERMKENGYLLIRGLQVRENVLRARHRILEHINQQGAIKPGTDPDDAFVNVGGKHAHTMGQRVITHDPAVRSVLESPEIFGFFESFFAKQCLTFDYKWLRCVCRPDGTGAHIDIVYMGRGSTTNLFTVWTPFGDIPLELGPLALCVGSHNGAGFEKVRQTYGKMDVDRDRVNGWFSDDPTEMVDKFGGKWQTTNFRAGDVLIFGMFTMHGSLANTTDRWRISCDTRFQPADEPVDERWVGENPKAHYAWYTEPDKMVAMDKARDKWGV